MAKTQLTEEQKKARALKAKETRERNKAKKQALLEKEKESEKEVKTIEVVSDDSITEQDLLNAETKVEETKVEETKVEETKVEVVEPFENILPELQEGDSKKEEEDIIQIENDAPELQEGDSETEVEEDNLGDEVLENYLTNAITNQVKRNLDDGNMIIDSSAIKTFVQESCNQCRYSDVKKAFEFTIKCIKKISKEVTIK